MDRKYDLEERLIRFAMRKIRASTLVEVLVAMVIVMLTFGFAIMIYVNVLNTTNQRQKIKVHLLMNQIAVEAKNENSYIDEDYDMEALRIVKSILPYKNMGNNLSVLILEAYDGKGEKIGERKELVLVKK